MNDSPALALKAQSLQRKYPSEAMGQSKIALDAFDLELKEGEALMLVGPNGAGKSTALRLLAGIEKPNLGKLEVFGDSPRSMRNRRDIGYLADSSPLFPFLDAVETLSFFAAAAKIPKQEQKARVQEMRKLFGMEEWAKKRVKSYSMGMRRRLGLACVLIGKPKLLLLDEPVSGLDPASRRQFMEILRQEKNEGRSIILSSHHMGLAEELVDRVVVVKSSKKVFDGSMEDLAKLIGARDYTLESFDFNELAALEGFLKTLGSEGQSLRISERGLEDFLMGDTE